MSPTDPTTFVKTQRYEAHRKERANRGFSDEDWWNFDTYIAWVICGAVEKMRADGHTMFSYDDVPESEWHARTDADYDTMIKGFGTWASGSWSIFGDEETRAVEDLDAALEIFKTQFKSLWD